MDVTTAHLMPECYRGTSPRSASTPGPAPDSPASASGRFSASPLLSPCFPYYNPHLHNASTLSLMGLNSPFLAPVLNPYALGLAAAGLPAPALLHPGLSPAGPAGPIPKTSLSPPRALSFSVENILKPDFGSAKPNGPEAGKPDEGRILPTKEIVPSVHKAVKRPPPPSSLPPPPTGEPKKIKVDEPKALSKPENTSSAPVDLSKESATSSAPNGTADKEGNEGSEGQTELPSDPLKMIDPAKWPAWIFCTRYSDRPSSGPRTRRVKKDRKPEEKRPRTAFTSEQLARLKTEFTENRYLTEKRRQDLARELNLHENQIKIWFQNKRAKIKKSTGQKNPLALQLMAQGLYNHSTVPVDEDEDDECFLQES